MLAACLAGFALAKGAEARFVRGLAAERRPWPAVLLALGVAGAVAAASFGVRLLGADNGWTGAPTIWMAITALVVPALAAVAAPRQFAVALLAGWTGAAATAAIYSFTSAVLELNENGYDMGRVPIAIFGATLLALAVVAVRLARAAPASEADREATA